MFCQSCGTKLDDGVAFCPNCGTKQNNAMAPQATDNAGYVQQPQQYNQQQYYPAQDYNQAGQYSFNGVKPSPKSVSFGEAIKLFFTNYANFSGRAVKSEYWWAFLFNFLVGLLVGWIPFIGWIVSLALFIPGLAVCIRRLHDTGKAWPYIFMGLIPLVGFIILIVFLCGDSDGDNKWGPMPR